MSSSSRIAAAVTLLLALAPALAFAQVTSQLRLSWDRCAADGKVADRSFACDLNSGEEVLYASVVLGDEAPHANITAFEAYLDVTTTASTLPPWWQLSSGHCRTDGLYLVLDGNLVANGSCVPWFQADGDLSRQVLVAWTFEYGYDGPGSVRARFIAAVPAGSEVTIPAGPQEVLLARVRLRHLKSAGTGSCSGCLVPACLGLGHFRFQFSGEPQHIVLGTVASTVTWQGGYVSSYQPTSPWTDYAYHPYRGHLVCATGPVPGASRTWGTIKTLYR